MKPESKAPAATPVLPPDYHLHTSLCNHADGMPADYRAAARKKGLPEICVADHVPTPDNYDIDSRMELADFERYRAAVLGLRDGIRPEVLFGIEADYYEGGEAFLAKWLPKQDFDLVIGSVHYIGSWGFDNPVNLASWKAVDVKGAWRSYFDLLVRMAKTRLYDVVGHIDVPKKFGHRLPDPVLKEMAQPVFDCLADAGMGIEINTSGLRKPVGEIYPSPLLLAFARERGIPICFGSDAHAPADVGADFDKAVILAKEAGYTTSLRFRKRNGAFVPLPTSVPGSSR